MKQSNDRITKKKQKGSLTLEAAIVTPFFLLILVFILNFLNMFYLQLLIQQKLNNIANTVAEYSYAIVLAGGDIGDLALDGGTKQKETKLTQEIADISSSAQDLFGLLNNGLQLDTLGELINTGKRLKTNIDSARNTIGDIGPDDVNSYILSTLLDKGGGSLVGLMMDGYLEDMKVNRGLIDGEIYYHVYIDQASGNDMVFVADYYYKQPLTMIRQEPIPMRQVVRVHPWVGGDTEGLRGRKE